MLANVHRQRLAPDFAADGTRWASKTRTLLNLRHEIGVVGHDDYSSALVALTRSHATAGVQPNDDAVMGDIAR